MEPDANDEEWKGIVDGEPEEDDAEDDAVESESDEPGIPAEDSFNGKELTLPN